MLTVIIIILGASFVLYTLLGGADFGAGIIETFAGKREEKTISKAIAPVWEANHIWLILAVVILFTGFPAVYASLSLALHIPLMLVLLGIIFRGSAFIFRQYDVVDDKAHVYFTVLFRISSLLTPIFLGMVVGAMMLGRITFDNSVGFYKMFVWPWLNLFCFAMGIFSVCLFSYLAAVFLVGETKVDKERLMYVKFAKRLMGLTIVAGFIVFALAQFEGHPLTAAFFSSLPSIVMLGMAAVLCFVIWHYLNKRENKTVYLRFGVGLQVTCVLLGWFAIQYPIIIQVQDGNHLTFQNTRAPDATLFQLLIALIVGLVLVVPGFLFLFKVFKVDAKASTL